MTCTLRVAQDDGRRRRGAALRVLGGALLLAAACARPAHAQQGFDLVGARAGGMAGAFVAVADDASAAYWNPAGLPSVPLFDAVVDVGGLRVGEDGSGLLTAASPKARRRTAGFALGVPVMGFSYFRLDTAAAALIATAPGGPGRQDPGTAVVAGALRTHNVGVTVVQSIGDAVVLGGTVRLVRAEAAHEVLGAGLSGDAALDAASDLEGVGHTRVDADLGLMAYVGRVRVGAVVRNLGAPAYDTGTGESVEVQRAARVGVSWGSEPVRGRRAWVLALDADLTKAEALDGERRVVAAGAERWFRDGRVALRAGAQAQTVGDARPVVTGGASAVVWSGLLVDAHLLAGDGQAGRGWGIAARVTF